MTVYAYVVLAAIGYAACYGLGMLLGWAYRKVYPTQMYLTVTAKIIQAHPFRRALGLMMLWAQERGREAAAMEVEAIPGIDTDDENCCSMIGLRKSDAVAAARGEASA